MLYHFMLWYFSSTKFKGKKKEHVSLEVSKLGTEQATSKKGVFFLSCFPEHSNRLQYRKMRESELVGA